MTTGKINIDNYTLVTMSVSEMNHRIAKAIADEREACAQIADEHPDPDEDNIPDDVMDAIKEDPIAAITGGVVLTKRSIAAAIRARGNA